MDDVALDARQPEVTATVAVGETFVVETNLVSHWLKRSRTLLSNTREFVRFHKPNDARR